MQKRTIITIAGATTLTLLASTSALALNLRGADNVSPGDVGTFTPKETTAAITPRIATVYVDVPTASAGVAPPAPATPTAVIAAPGPAVTLPAAPPAAAPVTTTQASSYSDDEHEDETEDHESEDHDSEDHDSEEGGRHDDD